MHSLYDNEMKLEFLSKSSNEAFARITVAAFHLTDFPFIINFNYSCNSTHF